MVAPVEGSENYTFFMGNLEISLMIISDKIKSML